MDIERFLDREALQKASLHKRSIAFFIDSFLLSLIVMIIFFDTFSEINSSSMLETMAIISPMIMEPYLILALLYHWFFVYMYGASVGKIAMKIRVIDLRTGDNPSILGALNRSAVRIVSEMVMYLGFLWAFLDPHRQAWHDKSSHTLVIDA